MPTPLPSQRTSRYVYLFLLTGILFAVSQLLARMTDWAWVELFARLATWCWLFVSFAWVARWVWSRLFWSVGRRLAFSYVLVGVLPLGLIGLLGLVATYLLGGLLLGHLYRDAVSTLRQELVVAATAQLEDGAEPDLAVDPDVAIRVAHYRNGRRLEAGGPAPESWPAWLSGVAAPDEPGAAGASPTLIALPDGSISLAASTGDAERGVVAWYEGDLSSALRRRTSSWLQLYRADDPQKVPSTRFTIGTRAITFRGLSLDRTEAQLADFYRLNPPADPARPSWRERPLVAWMESAEALPALATGEDAADGAVVALAGSPRGIARAILSKTERSDSTALLALLALAVLLFEIWAVAAAVAVFMIYGLSRAVNRLSRATDAIGRGDFAVRIPARRRDQLGDLQRSFNAMAEHLGELVETAAQKEALDKELALARKVQQDLLPDAIGEHPGLGIATFFEPSSAIGGDYFDVLERPDGRLALVIADVAGHGLAAGLRMAMVKSALELMVVDGRPAVEIVPRLHRLLRRRTGDRTFVTLSVADFDSGTGDLELTNAGHPPCYVVRARGGVEEIVAPGLPLGALAGAPGHAVLSLGPGDGVVFLSDGIIECRDEHGEQLGYERVRRALESSPPQAQAMVDRLVAAVRAHCGDAPAEDDRTALAVVYRPPPVAAPSTSSPSRP